MSNTFEVTDLDGSNKRTHTLETLRAEIEAGKKAAMEKFRADAAKAGLQIHPRFQEK